MGSTRESEADSWEDSPVTPTQIGAGAAVMDTVALSAVGYFALDNVALGAIAGLLLGLGTFCFFPVLTQGSENEGLAERTPENDDAPLRAFHRLAAGFGLSAAGILLIATGFVEVDFRIGLPAALSAAVVIYLVAGFALPNAQLRH